jgi:predicted dehydrogenase/threonine dehydrogenase-like Zn-dependent dehydrogenase
MKQIIQDMVKGGPVVVEAPAPQSKKNHVVINTNMTLISAGTERMLVEFGRANLLDKARAQPDKVKMVIEKVQTDGLISTIDTVKSKLSQPIPLGYCNVGTIGNLFKGADHFKVGDRVVSNGPHADVVRVSKNLIAKIPENVSNEEASFTVVASIGLQGIRLANPTMGECFVVTGVGLIGLLTVQILRAHGCRVLAIDLDQSKLELAKQYGAEICNPGKGEDAVDVGMAFSRGNGVDGVIITASSKSNDPVTQAARMSRKRGRIILVGVTGLELNRADFYEKELTFQVSCSYGPGRYDSNYEEKGNDYPIGFVRWTEQRNFEAILDMMSIGLLDVKSLITKRFNFEDASDAYELLTNKKSALGIILDFKSEIPNRHNKKIQISKLKKYSPKEPVIGFVGAGNYASRVLIPSFKDTGSQFHSIASSGGINGVIHGEKAGFFEATTDTDAMIENPLINTIIIATRHNSHAHFVEQALKAGKHVFVEKPLAISHEELDKVKAAYSLSKNSKLMVGFNRRFSPQIQKIKQLLEPIKEPKSFIMTMNAGSIESDHWTQDINVGGGRIIGEACHFIDLMRYLADSEIVSLQALKMGENDYLQITEDKAAIMLGFADGSFGTINYLANGASNFPKERIEVFTACGTLQLDNFVKLKGFGWKGFNKLNLWKQNKGQKECAAAFIKSIKDGAPAPISADELFEVAKVTIDIAENLRKQQ